MSQAIHSLLLAGATGLVGHEALVQALALPCAPRVHALVRRRPDAAAALGLANDRLDWLQVDYARLASRPGLPRADAALCALGTTIAVAGSQAAFRAVDHDAVLAFARAARAAGAERLAVVSALGADAQSSVFYNRIKGETEAALREVGFRTLVIARPSLLVGDRAALGQPVRTGERLGLWLTRPLGRLVPAAWRPISADRVARALLHALVANRPGAQVLESSTLQKMGQET